MTTPDRRCPTCSTPVDLDIVWTMDSDGDGPYTRSWHTPELATPAICPGCDAEVDGELLGGWLDEIAQEGWTSKPPYDYDEPTIPW